MNISVTLNGKKTVFEAQSDESLMSVLHNKTSAHVKCGCLQGFCGACTVLLNNEPVAACKLPVGIIRNAEIITLDYFEKSIVFFLKVWYNMSATHWNISTNKGVL